MRSTEALLRQAPIVFIPGVRIKNIQTGYTRKIALPPGCLQVSTRTRVDRSELASTRTSIYCVEVNEIAQDVPLHGRTFSG